MSDEPRGPNWWQASDGKWYPPAPSGSGNVAPPVGQGAYGVPGQYGSAGQYGMVPPPQFAPAGPSGTNGLAIASLVCGLLWACGITSVLALIFGIIALNQVKTSRQGGKGLAVAGIVLGAIGLLAAIGFWVLGTVLSNEVRRTSPFPDISIDGATLDEFNDQTFRTIPAVTEAPDASVVIPVETVVTSGEAGSTPEVTVIIPVITAPAVPAGEFIYGTGECAAADGSAPVTKSFAGPPQRCIDPGKTYIANVETSMGAYTITLDPTLAPGTVNNFVNLARFHFFDDTVCHRAIPGFVVQCGDPTATGTGDPGYSFADELPAPGAYRTGSVAMANAGPDTNGSQFFIITGDDGAALPPDYTLFGEVTVGLDTTVAAMDAAANPNSDGVPPLQEIRIISVTITEA